jgi:hypothetical protein
VTSLPKTGDIVLRPAKSSATDYVVYSRAGDTPWEIMQTGRYYDRFVRRVDKWLFSENRPVKLGA